MSLRALGEKSADADLLREMIGFAAQRLMELDAEAPTRAPHGSRDPERINHRNGHRDRLWETRSADDLVKALGMTGTSKSRVSRLCAEIDDQGRTFLNRPLEGEWPHLWQDATKLKVRQNGRIVSVAAIIAVGVNSDGRRKVLGLAIGASEAEALLTDFPRSLARRGLSGVKLVISDAHEGLEAAVAKVQHASWQRCRVHFMRTSWRMPAGRAAASSPPSSEPPLPKPPSA